MWEHRFSGAWSDYNDAPSRRRVLIESGADGLDDIIEAFKSYLKAVGFMWDAETTPFVDELVDLPADKE